MTRVLIFFWGPTTTRNFNTFIYIRLESKALNFVLLINLFLYLWFSTKSINHKIMTEMGITSHSSPLTPPPHCSHVNDKMNKVKKLSNEEWNLFVLGYPLHSTLLLFAFLAALGYRPGKKRITNWTLNVKIWVQLKHFDLRELSASFIVFYVQWDTVGPTLLFMRKLLEVKIDNYLLCK